MTIMSDPERVCAELLRAASHSGPPTNLEAVCSLWSDLGVVEEDLDQEGYLVSLGFLGADILVRSSDPPTRKSFTLAHELGHWTLANMEAGRILFDKNSRATLPPRTEHKRQTPEEIWCNKFASCLLMPREDLNNYLQDPRQPGLLDKICNGHSVFQVSQEAFLSRITETTPINVFEVVTTNSNPRIRRKFFSGSTDERKGGESNNGVAREIPPRTNLGLRGGMVDKYQIQLKVTAQSSYGRTLMVSVVPEQL